LINSLKNVFIWNFKKVYFIIIEKIFYSKEAIKTYTFSSPYSIDIYVIAFNNPTIIGLLISQLHKYLNFKFNLFVFDNSSSLVSRNLIYDVCKQNYTSYFSLPLHSKKFSHSQSHALAINWIFKKIIKKRVVNNFMFLDHDVFPFKKIESSDLFNSNKAYVILHSAISFSEEANVFQKKAKYKYLWPGFFTFSRKHLNALKSVSFMPFSKYNYYFDTGGKTYKLVSGIFKDEIKPLSCNRVIDSEGNNLDIIDSKWLHTISGSNWRGLNLVKDYEIIQLNKFIND